jgi:flagellar hook-associated protein 3 FlgL
LISSFYPVIAGRVSNGLTRNRALYQIQSDQAALQQLQTQLATGYKFQSVSESPSAAIRVMNLQREQEFKEQAIVNLKSAQSYLNTTETSLGEAQSILNDVKAIALEGVSNTLSTTERNALLNQLDSHLGRMVSIGNQRSRDRFLFAGGEVGQLPIENIGGVTRFNGNDLDLLSIGDRQNYITHNVTSQKALGVISSGVNGSVDLNPAISDTTRLADLNQGFGVGIGAVQFTDGTNEETIDLSTAETLGDVASRINQVTLDGRPLQAILTSNGLTIQYADSLPGTLRISDAASGRVGKNLGIVTTDPIPTLPIVGDDLNPILRTTTLLSDLNDGVGFNLSEGLKIVQGSKTYTVDFTGASTVEDLLNAVNNSGAQVLADVSPDGRGFRIRSLESGSDFSIAESFGTLASQLGLRTFHGQVRLADLNHGKGLELAEGADLIFSRSDGTEFSVDISSAITVQDAVDLINNHPDNQDLNLRIVASFRTPENGLALTALVPPLPVPLPDPAPPPPVPITVRSAGGSSAAQGLGLSAIGSSIGNATESSGAYVLNGRDINPHETTGVYNSLLRLRDAIRDQDVSEIGRASQMIDDDIDRISLARGEVGIRQQKNDSLIATNEDQVTELKSQESEERDVNIADAISQLTARQAAYEANLKLLAQVSRSTIFDYI